MNVSFLLGLLALQAEPFCLDEVFDALEDGQFHQVLDMTAEPSACIGEMERQTARTEAAWVSGDLQTAGAAAVEALDAYRLEGCAYHRNAAQLAFAAGLSLVSSDYQQGRYFFWVAYRVHDLARSLRPGQADLAEHYADEFGTSINDDPYLFNSPYLGERRAPALSCGRVPRIRLEERAPTDYAILWLEFRQNARGDINGTRVNFAYPGPVPRSVIDGINDMEGYAGSARFEHLVTLDPCLQPFRTDRPVTVCLPGHRPGEIERDVWSGKPPAQIDQ